MDVMKKVACKHGLMCLLHEKPFAGVNGSGTVSYTHLDVYKRQDLICSFTPKSNDLDCFNYMKFSNYGDVIFTSIDISNHDLNSTSPFYLDIYLSLIHIFRRYICQ